jgi:hypothetical protein
MHPCIENSIVICTNSENSPVYPGRTRNHIKFFFSHLPKFPLPFCGAHDQSRTGEPLPYQGSALPTELHGLDTNEQIKLKRELVYGAGDEIRTRDIQLGRLKLYQLSYSRINHIVNKPKSTM